MIHSSLISSLFSATLHGGIVAAVAWTTYESQVNTEPAVVRVIFQKPSHEMVLPQKPPKKSNFYNVISEKENRTSSIHREESEEGIYASTLPIEQFTDVTYDEEGFSNPLPKYPLVARKRGHEGCVGVKVRVSKSGQVDNISLIASSGWSDLDDATIEILKHWQFKPATRAGLPVNGSVELTFTFQLNATKIIVD